MLYDRLELPSQSFVKVVFINAGLVRTFFSQVPRLYAEMLALR